MIMYKTQILPRKIGLINITFTSVLFIILCLLTTSCNNSNSQQYHTSGVSKELADHRVEQIKDLQYKLHFNIPSQIDSSVTGEVKIEFTTPTKDDIILDFFAPKESVLAVKCNGENSNYTFNNQHIIISRGNIKKGENSIEIHFISTDRALNRRDEFLYTLLVPDRARTLFPLFDQPSLKAQYTLSLNVPKGWVAVANGPLTMEHIKKKGDHNTLHFNTTKPISSYLFSFVAGKFSYVSKERNGKEHRIYHREKDEYNIQQFDQIFAELFHSLDWLEEYTAIEYPFAKYDMVLVPGFQYGGMEHVGSTIYNASTMFLSKSATINNRISRVKLIAHETAHMWFGDYITMSWFNDVWTKEVFANFFAAKITAPLFPELDEKQTMLNYFSAAYSEDRTIGGTSIKQELDNMQYAGLIYNSIIYNKSPIVLNMIYEMLGEDQFQNAVREALNTYSYDCATWEQWVEIFDKHSDKNITEWAYNWMYKSGMPQISYNLNDNKLTIYQEDNKDRGLIWEQKLNFAAISQSGEREEKTVNLTEQSGEIEFSFTPKYIQPNNDGNGYGFFKMDRASIEYTISNFKNLNSATQKRMALINLYDNLLQNREVSMEYFITQMLQNLQTERDPLVYSTTLGYISTLYKTYLQPKEGDEAYKRVGKIIDSQLWQLYDNNPNKSIKSSLFRQIYALKISDNTKERLYNIWNRTESGFTLGERDYIDLSLHLALAYPKKALKIIESQKERITNKDMLQEYNFVSRALSPNKDDRDKIFQSLLNEENRRVEKWASSAMSFLVTKRDGVEPIEYIIPALQKLPEIQRTGDIFYPQGWCSSLLQGYNSEQAYKKVNEYLKNNPDIHPLLKSKLLISADHLYKIYNN